ncbi:MAG TPA: nucleotidyltransferase domain-containing protein [Acidimicrobiia bacterium]|nr:nucleotidyltransferase domain-containing protein [Acidimicrobiia bacterium]
MELNYDHNRLVEICEKYGVRELRIFGSFAHGNANQESDVDVLYEFTDSSAIGIELIDFADDLEELFHRKVDIVSLKHVPEYLTELMVAPSVQIYDAA